MKKKMKLKKESERVVWLELERSGGFYKNQSLYLCTRIFGLQRNNLSLPSVFQFLLQEFEDMFQDKEIPPVKGTEHQVDFIPGSIIPNKRIYRVNPTEIKEIQRQVEELREKGYI